MSAKKRKACKTLLVMLALCLLIGGVIGGTVAYLIDRTPTVKNTFTTSDVKIELTETGVDENNKQSFKMVPGATIKKDPTVTVKAGSEACYVFVKVEKSTNFGTYMTYGMAEGWNQLKDGNGTDVAGVFYREVATGNKDQAFAVLANDQVTVLPSVTKGMMADAKNANPTLTFTAYAIQKNYLVKDGATINSPYGAWTLITP